MLCHHLLGVRTSLAFAISQTLKFTNQQCLREVKAPIYFFLLKIVVKEVKIMGDKDKNQMMGRGRGWEACKNISQECFVCFAELWQSTNCLNYEIKEKSSYLKKVNYSFSTHNIHPISQLIQSIPVHLQSGVQVQMLSSNFYWKWVLPISPS